MSRVRKGLGYDADLMVDADLPRHCKAAISTNAFAAHTIFWFEEPLLPDDDESYRRLCEARPVRITTAEEEDSRRSFRQLIVEGGDWMSCRSK